MSFFYEMLSYFPMEMQEILNKIDDIAVNKLTEIRIRRNKPLSVIIKNTTYFLQINGDLANTVGYDYFIVNDALFEKAFYSFCNYSLYNNMDEIIEGYITLKCGARVGITGTATNCNNKIVSVKNITSLNIRIPNQVNGCSKELLNVLYINTFPSIIVAGKPNSGKTTLIRDIVCNLAGGFNNKYRKVCVIDERNEICGKFNDKFSMDIGVTTDVITGFPKHKGIEIAIRTMSPELIVCDEISTIDEAKVISYGFSAGVKFILSIHCDTYDDLLNKDIVKALLKTNEFSYIILLDDYTYSYKIIDTKEVYNEIFGKCMSNDFFNKFGCKIV